MCNRNLPTVREMHRLKWTRPMHTFQSKQRRGIFNFQSDMHEQLVSIEIEMIGVEMEMEMTKSTLRRNLIMVRVRASGYAVTVAIDRPFFTVNTI